MSWLFFQLQHEAGPVRKDASSGFAQTKPSYTARFLQTLEVIWSRAACSCHSFSYHAAEYLNSWYMPFTVVPKLLILFVRYAAFEATSAHLCATQWMCVRRGEIPGKWTPTPLTQPSMTSPPSKLNPMTFQQSIPLVCNTLCTLSKTHSEVPDITVQFPRNNV